MKLLRQSAKRRRSYGGSGLLRPSCSPVFVSPVLAGAKKTIPAKLAIVDKGINFYSIEKEIALGKQMAQGSRAAGQDCGRSNYRGIC